MATLRLITLPIGNIQDITGRVKSALEDEEFFLAEDTRVLKKLMSILNIDFSGKSIECFNDHSDLKISSYMDRLDSGSNINLVSDAGSPIISDPAYPLLKEAINKGHSVETFPGASAVTAALELSGLAPTPFHFYGFIAREKGKKLSIFKGINKVPGTHIFFESPNRMESSLEILAYNFPEINIAVVREMTKKFETVYRFKAKNYLEMNINFKGEFVLLLNNHLSKDQKTGDYEELKELAHKYLEKGSKPKVLAKILGKILEKDTKEVYNLLTLNK